MEHRSVVFFQLVLLARRLSSYAHAFAALVGSAEAVLLHIARRAALALVVLPISHTVRGRSPGKCAHMHGFRLCC